MQTRLALARVIKEKIATWSITEKGISIIPENSLMHIIDIDYESYENTELMFRGYIKLTDFTDVWAKVLECSLGVKDFSLSVVFKELLGLEVSLKWKGLFRKQPFFTLNPRLQEIGEEMSNLKTNNKLAITLNNDRCLLKAITKIKLYILDVELTNNLITWKQRIKPKNHYKETFDPNDIIWRISAMIRYPRTIFPLTNEKRITSLLDVMETVSGIIIEVSREIINTL